MNQHRRPQSRNVRSTTSRSPIRRLLAIGMLGLGGSLGACTDPPVDTNEPPPTGVIQGSIQYIGPRVLCDYAGTAPTRVKGRILMTLVDDANPLPPEGTSQRPTDFLAVGGEDIFTDLANECMPLSPTPQDQAVIIQRSVAFRWPNIPLGKPLSAADLTDPVKIAAAQSRYRIQGFYDGEGDFNPLFTVQQTTSAGDIAGGAVENPLAATPKFLVLRFDSQTLRPEGELVSGVNVSLGAVVLTEPPIMRVENGRISSQETIPFPPLPGSFPSIDLTLYGRNPADADRVQLDASMNALGLGGFADFANPAEYALYVRPVDVDGDGDTTCPTAADKDCHPVFGTFGFSWNAPIVFLYRQQNAVEVQAGLPAVALVPQAGIEPAGNPGAQYPNTSLRVFPTPALLTSPTHPECRAVYFNNGTNGGLVSMLSGALPTGTIAECAEMPTGRYGVNFLGGVAGSPLMIQPNADTAQSETGFSIVGGNFGSQVWRIPNEFGDYHQVGDALIPGRTDPGSFSCLPAGDTSTAAPRCIPEQSLAGTVVVEDPDTSNAPSRRDPNAGSLCSAYDLSNNPWAAAPLQEACCAPIMHLCGLPLCPTESLTQTWSATALTTRAQPTSITGTTTYTIDGRTVEVGIPNCVPFDMPQQCCPGTRP